MYEFIFPAGFSSDYNENTKKKKIDFLLIFFLFCFGFAENVGSLRKKGSGHNDRYLKDLIYMRS